MGSPPDEMSYKSTTGSNRMKMVVDRVNKSARCRCCLWVLALWCAATVIFMLAGYDSVVRTVAVDQMVLRHGSQKYQAWVNTPVPVYYRVYVFNLTNPVQFMDGFRPRVQERGPYVYLMKETKEQIRFYKNGSVSYRTRPLYFYQPHLSQGAEEDEIVTVNIPFVNAADAVKEAGFLRTIIQYAKKIHGFDTIRKLTVRELLWGHRSRVMDWARTLQDVPYPHQLFGLLVGFNDTVQEPYTMHTGKGDPSKMNQIVSWNGHQSLSFWSGDTCNQIRGTDASGFAPGVSKDETLYIFNGQLCRALPLVYNATVTQSGISAYRFVPPHDIFSYGRDHPENACFCSSTGCPPKGILDMKPCYWGASIGFSFPHFFEGDLKLLHNVRGLRPDPEKHRTEFDIYPDLGVPLRVKLRMQMNVILDRDQALERARHYDLVLPIFWFEVGIDSLPGEVVGLLKLAQNLPPVVKTTSVTLCTALTIIFLILLLAQTIAAWCGWGTSDDERPPRTPEPPYPDPHQPPPHYLTPHPWDYDVLQKPRHCGSTASSSLSSTLPPPAGMMEIPIIDDHTLLPPYRRRHMDIPLSTQPIHDEESIDQVDQVPPPYSPGPPQRTPSTVSVEIHTTASDDDLPDLPLDPPVPRIAPLQHFPPNYPALIQPLSETVEEKEEISDDDDDDDDDEPSTEPEKVTPSTPPPLPGEEVIAPLARVEDTKDLEVNNGGRVPSPLSSPPTPAPPLATSSPHGSSVGNDDSRSHLPPPLESDL